MVNLHIERLVLDGINIESAQRHVLQASAITELTRMLSEGGFSSSLADGNQLSCLITDSIQLTGGDSPTQIGQQIAQSVYGGISRE